MLLLEPSNLNHDFTDSFLHLGLWTPAHYHIPLLHSQAHPNKPTVSDSFGGILSLIQIAFQVKECSKPTFQLPTPCPLVFLSGGSSFRHNGTQVGGWGELISGFHAKTPTNKEQNFPYQQFRELQANQLTWWP